MADYFGTGYLSSIARCGAASIAPPAQRTNTLLGERESSFRRGDGQPSKTESESQGPSPTTAMTASGSTFGTLDETGVTDTSTAFDGPSSSLPLPGSTETQQVGRPAGEGLKRQLASPKNPGFEMEPPSRATPYKGLAEVTPVRPSAGEDHEGLHEVDASEISIGHRDRRIKETLAALDGPMVSLPLPTFRPSPAEPIASHPVSAAGPQALEVPARESLGSSSQNQVNQGFALHIQSSAAEAYGTAEPATDVAPGGHTSEVQAGEVLSSRREVVTRHKPATSRDLTLAPLFEDYTPPPLRESLLVYPPNSAGRQPPSAVATPEPAPSQYWINEVFETRMPKNFFGNQNDVLADASPQATLRPRDNSSGAPASVPARITEQLGGIARVEASDGRTLESERSSATPKVYSNANNSREAGEPGPEILVSLTPEPNRRPNPISKVSPQPAAVALAGLNRVIRRSEPPIAKHSSAIHVAPPQPRDKHATHFGRREPPARSPQPRLRINRLEIQIVNQPIATVSSGTSAADTGQSLERRLIGRTGMIL